MLYSCVFMLVCVLFSHTCVYVSYLIHMLIHMRLHVCGLYIVTTTSSSISLFIPILKFIYRLLYLLHLPYVNESERVRER